MPHGAAVSWAVLHFVEWSSLRDRCAYHSVAAIVCPYAHSTTSDNIGSQQLKFSDGSVANLLYAGERDRAFQGYSKCSAKCDPRGLEDFLTPNSYAAGGFRVQERTDKG